jgi:ribokinase
VIAVVGSINLDLVVGVTRHPRPGETVVGGDCRQLPGGKGANQAVAAARLGGEVAMVGRVGAEERDEWLRGGL